MCKRMNMSSWAQMSSMCECLIIRSCDYGFSSVSSIERIKRKILLHYDWKMSIILATQKQPYDATYITHNNNSAVFVVRLIVNVLSHSDTLRSHGRKVDLLFCQKDLYLFVSLYRCFWSEINFDHNQWFSRGPQDDLKLFKTSIKISQN